MLRLVFVLLAVLGHTEGTAQSCLGRCDQPLSSNYQCQCNSACTKYNDCCNDYQAICLGGTCEGRCGTGVDNNKPCQCNTACITYGDCCDDYNTYCNDNGASPEPCDMSCLAQKLWDNDVNKISLIDVNHNYQGQTSSSGSTDAASTKLFVYVNENHFNSKPTFKKFIALLDNYNRNIGQREELTAAEWTEIEDFLNTAIETQVMQLAYGYLLDNGLVTDAANFKDTLRELWFNLYPRSSGAGSSVDSSGFEHAIVGELRGTVSGFHSWIQFYLEEKKGNIDYHGWVSKSDDMVPPTRDSTMYIEDGSNMPKCRVKHLQRFNKIPEIIGAKFTWYGQMKSKGSFFMRTSPEFDLALYSVCALTKPNSICSFTMANHNIRIQTWDVSHKAGTQIGSAYPAI